jgi:hypothetical protein
LRALQVSLMSVGFLLLIALLLVVTRVRTYYHQSRLEHIENEHVWQRVFGETGLRPAAFEKLPNDHPLRANSKRLSALVERRSESDRQKLSTMRSNLPPLGRWLVYAVELLESDQEKTPNVFVDQIIHAPTADDPKLFVVLSSPSGSLRHFAFNIGTDDIERIKWSEGPFGSDPDDFTPEIVGTIAVLWVVWVVWGFLFRGGVSYRLSGIMLVRSSGRRALRFQVLWRSILFWTPLLATIIGAFWIDAYDSDNARLGDALNWSTLFILAGYTLAIVRSPSNHWHDGLSGVHLVTR